MENFDKLNYELQKYSIRNNQWILVQGQLIKSVASVIRLFFIMNAGAIISLLTFAGNKSSDFSFKNLYWSFVIFLVGVMCILICVGMEFFRQNYALRNFNRRWEEELEQSKINEEDRKKQEQYQCRLIWTARVFAFLSVVSFIVGVITALNTLSC